MLQLHSTNLMLHDFTPADEAAYSALRQDEQFQRFYPDEQCTDAFLPALGLAVLCLAVHCQQPQG